MAEPGPRLIAVIGGGAAGFFGAIRAAEQGKSSVRVVLLEATRRVLQKLRISGGGRCNVTHACFDPAQLVKGYPRGERELRGPFSRYQPKDTVEWFASRGVELKTEADGRMFPVTDDSATIAGCLERAAASAGVEVTLGASVTNVARMAAGFELTLKDGTLLTADRILVATGSAPVGYDIARTFGHTLEPLVPSLFTFKIQDPRIAGLAGVSVPSAHLALVVGGQTLEREGPLLVTHWGLSGPAVLKLSAFGAVPLHGTSYSAELRIGFLPGLNAAAAETALRAYKDAHPRQQVSASGPFDQLPRRLWTSLAVASGATDLMTYADLPKAVLQRLATELTGGSYAVRGKGPFKEEFVTAGGVRLNEVDFKTMESRLCPGLHFAGEVLDIDGITGGFNFQAAWTTGFLAGTSLASGHVPATPD